MNIITQVIAVIISIIILIIAFVAKLFGGKVVTGGGAALTPLQREIGREYSDLKLPKHKIPFDEFCYPKRFKLQNPQKFIAEYMAPGTQHMNLLGFHGLGSGKSCAAIQFAEMWKHVGKPLIVMPASLVPNFRNELRGECADESYLTKAEREELKSLHHKSDRYKEIIKKSDELIDSTYSLMSYNKFINEYKGLDPPAMVIDEVHNISNPAGTYHRLIKKFIEEHPKMKLLILSATPIFDNPFELVHLLRLLRQDVSDDILFDKDLLRKKLDGLISYYAGAPPHVYAKTTIHYEICKMSRFQTKWYHAEVEGELRKSGDVKLHDVTNNFYAKSRARSNIVFPQGLAGTDGLPKLSKVMIKDNIDTYSCKFARLMKKLRKSQLSFIYSNFASFGGIRSLVKCMRAFGYSDYRTEGPGRKFAIFSGEETPQEKANIQRIYNSPENDDGSKIQVIIGSPAMREGISLLRCRSVHVLDPYWNYSRLEQIAARAVRMCSHKSLPARERTVDIYFYIAVANNSTLTKHNFVLRREITPQESVDGYILKIADKKRDENDKIVEVMIDSAADKLLNQRKK